ncbi:AbfB domain-containing protein [Kitasatospora indigofera]|uniref:AbfB domain-containing protein n=1 Tax=Kitasatospora indigofera TaxID=67307 RepID=UPI0033BC42EA
MESVNYPGHFLRHANYGIHLHSFDGSASTTPTPGHAPRPRRAHRRPEPGAAVVGEAGEGRS